MLKTMPAKFASKCSRTGQRIARDGIISNELAQRVTL